MLLVLPLWLALLQLVPIWHTGDPGAGRKIECDALDLE